MKSLTNYINEGLLDKMNEKLAGIQVGLVLQMNDNVPEVKAIIDKLQFAKGKFNPSMAAMILDMLMDLEGKISDREYEILKQGLGTIARTNKNS